MSITFEDLLCDRIRDEVQKYFIERPNQLINIKYLYKSICASIITDEDILLTIDDLWDANFITYEGAENIYSYKPSCTKPPKGWYCTRKELHEGPCVAWPVKEINAKD